MTCCCSRLMMLAIARTNTCQGWMMKLIREGYRGPVSILALVLSWQKAPLDQRDPVDPIFIQGGVEARLPIGGGTSEVMKEIIAKMIDL